MNPVTPANHSGSLRVVHGSGRIQLLSRNDLARKPDGRLAGRPIGESIALICDTSGSMANFAGVRRRIDLLHDALDALATMLPPGAMLIEFNDDAWSMPFKPGLRFTPDGGTRLDTALQEALRHNPRRTVVISDGEPDNPELALSAARRVPGIINTVYCGPGRNYVAIEFLNTLAMSSGGMHLCVDFLKDHSARPLIAAVAKVLLLPRPP